MKKRIMALFTLVCMVLCACGGDTKVDESLIGKYIAVTGEMMGMALVGDDLDGFSMELEKGGKGTMTLKGDSGSIKWSNDESTVTVTADGEDMVATRGQDYMVFEDMLGTGMKITFAKEGTDAANPELYLPETDKFLIGTWQSADVTDILGDPVEASEMAPDALKMVVHGDHTLDVTVEGKSFNGIRWENLGDYGSVDSEDIKVTWKIEDDGIKVDYVKDGEYYTFTCPKQ